MPTIALTVSAVQAARLQAVFGGTTAIETAALVKAFLTRKLVEEVRAAEQYAASEQAKAALSDILVT